VTRDVDEVVRSIKRIGARARAGRGRFPADPTKRGIANPMAFVEKALVDELRFRGGHLDPDKRAKATSYLLEVLCRVSSRYDPRLGSLSFTSFAYRILRRRYTSWLREDRGDSRYGNDGREESVAEPDLLRETFTEDQLDFAALVEQLDHDGLSQRARNTLKQMVRLIIEEGLTATEAARRLAKSRREAGSDLERLREELTAA